MNRDDAAYWLEIVADALVHRQRTMQAREVRYLAEESWERGPVWMRRAARLQLKLVRFPRRAAAACYRRGFGGQDYDVRALYVVAAILKACAEHVEAEQEAAANEARRARRIALASAAGEPHSDAMAAECHGEHCKMCNGEACNYCGAGCWANPFTIPLCEHDVDTRHEEPEHLQKGNHL